MNPAEITIRVGAVSAELTQAASAYLMNQFGGYFRTEGFGGYTFFNGTVKEENSISWQIASSIPGIQRRAIIAEFSRLYCHAGNQESVFYSTGTGAAYLVDSRGRFTPL